MAGAKDPGPKKILDEELGPPRLVKGWEAHDEECRRQVRLQEAGLLRRHNGLTWGWQKAEHSDGRMRWAWANAHAGATSAFDNRSDYERAWKLKLREWR